MEVQRDPRRRDRHVARRASLGASSIAKRKREWVRANERINAAVTAWNDFASCDIVLARRAINDNPIRSTTAERLNLRGYYAADWE